MSHVQQTCPLCNWARFVRVPQTADREYDELIARHVARSLQWEWQTHVARDHGEKMAHAYAALTVDAFDGWVIGEGRSRVTEEMPPSEGGGQTVGVNRPIITPDQARNLADAVEQTIVSAADQVQRFAEVMVPALHAAQETLTKGLRELVEQRPGRTATCSCGGVLDHCPGDAGCLLRPIPAGKANLISGQWRLEGIVEAPNNRPYGTVETEICSNCQRLAGEPHGLPSCGELS